jgi:hypothetical protein
MATRTRRKFIVFENPFELKEAGRVLPAGSYEIVTDEELVEGLSFPVYRRVATMMIVPAPAPHSASTELLTIDPVQLAAALARDTSAAPGSKPGGPEGAV